MTKEQRNPIYTLLTANRKIYLPTEITQFLQAIDEGRVQALTQALSSYIANNIPRAVERRSNLADYRINPYVVMTSASLLGLSDPQRFGAFLFNSKLYAGLETSFGKSVEAAIVGNYPAVPAARAWEEPPEKQAEFHDLQGLSRQEKARKRNTSVWREIDKSCILASHRYLVSIKSGPNCINDTQVSGMTRAIGENHQQWFEQTKVLYPEVTELDVVIGLTYGTDRTTNKKENQILVKLLDYGFVEEDRISKPGVLIDSATRRVRVYRCVGQDFWAVIGNPAAPSTARFVFIEVLLSLANALSLSKRSGNATVRLNAKIAELASAIGRLTLPLEDAPGWMQADLSDDEWLWLATAITSFYDQGI